MALGPAFAIFLVSLDYREALSLGIAGVGVVIAFVGLFVRYEKNPHLLPKEANYRVMFEKNFDIHEGQKDAKGLNSTPRSQNVHTLNASKTGRVGSSAARQGLINRYFEKTALNGAIPSLFYAIAITALIAYTAVYAQDAGYGNPSLYFVVAAITAIIVRLFSSKTLDAFKPIKVYVFPVVAGCLALLTLLLVRSEFIFILCGVGYGICIGISLPLLNAVAVKASPPDRFGAANALFYFIYEGGFGIGMCGWGFMIDNLGYSAMFISATVILIVSFIVALVLFPLVKTRE